MNPSHRKFSALRYALLTYITLVTAAITLCPFDFRIPERIEIGFTGSLSDVLENIVLYIPIGFLFRVACRRSGWLPLFKALCFGVLVSASLEACQLFLPGRNSSLIDVITNGMGVLLGAALAAHLRGRVMKEPASFLRAFEMPLMNVLYLLIPLLWLGSFSIGGEIDRLGLVALLGVYGGSILASVYVNQMSANQNLKGPILTIYVLAWFVIGAMPAVIVFPLEVSAIAVGVAAAAQLSAWFWKKGEKSEHRFEVSTLKRVFPLFGAYMLLVSVWPTTLPLAHWPNGLDYKRLSELQRIVFTARFIEVIAAFTLLGYMVAGLLGRKDESGLKTAGWVFGSSVMFSIVTALLRDLLSGPLSFLLEVALLTVTALYGALIYRLQLEAFRHMQTQEQSR
jgi:glycopeptide antibiotics resistance protein